jgi:hypothetical protein
MDDSGPAGRQKAAALPQKPVAIADVGRKERERPEPGNLHAVHPLTLHAFLG